MYLAALVPRLRARGHQVELVSEEGAKRSVVAESCYARVRAFGPDIILQNSLSDPTEALNLIETGLPVAFFAHDYGGMCISGTRRHARPALEICKKRFGVQCWRFYFNRRCGGLNPATAFALYRDNQLRLKCLLQADAVIVASEAMADVVRQHGVAQGRVKTVPLRSGAARVVTEHRRETPCGETCSVCRPTHGSQGVADASLRRRNSQRQRQRLDACVCW